AEAWIVDVHHRAHPATKNEDGMHGVSVGFTSHYAAMRERFGKRITVGCAGENIIADTGRLVALEELQDGDGGGGGGGGGVLTVVGRDGTEKVRLRVLQVAHPCRPFTGFALGSRVDAEVLKSHLQFLDGGMRGFYCVAEGTGVVEVGDLLLLA
ncbi:MAG: MOSC domain-containing protein, partial [bacterium]